MLQILVQLLHLRLLPPLAQAIVCLVRLVVTKLRLVPIKLEMLVMGATQMDDFI